MFKKLKKALLLAGTVGMMFIALPMTARAEGVVIQSKDIKHIHSSTNTTPCYTYSHQACGGHGLSWSGGSETWGCVYCGGTISGSWKCMSWTDCNGGWHQVGGKENDGTCTNCGAHAHHGSSGGSGTQYCGGRSSWSLTCKHSNEMLGTFAILQNGSTLTGSLTVVNDVDLGTISYNWKEGNKVLSDNAELEITKAGTFVCYITYTDPYSKKTQTTNLSIKITYSALVTSDQPVAIDNWAEQIFLKCDTIGGETASYQWYKNGNPIEGETGTTYTVTSYGTYYCKTKGTSGAVAESNHYVAYVGEIDVIKDISNGTYKLQNTTKNIMHDDEDNVTFSFKWTGKDNELSMHIDGAQANSVNSLTTPMIVVPDFGTYTCEITMKDKYRKSSETITKTIIVDDFDLEPPTIVSVEEIDFSGKTTGLSYTFDSETNTYTTPAKTTYRQIKGFRVTTEDNMALASYVINGNEREIEKSSTIAYFAYWSTKNTTIPIKVIDKMGNYTEYQIVVTHIDTEAPTITGVTFSENKFTNKDITVSVSAIDNCKLNSKYSYLVLPKEGVHTTEKASKKSIDKVDDYLKKNGFTKSGTFTLTDSHDYYAYVADEAGNISTYEFTVDWIDKSAPNVDSDAANINAECNNYTYNNKATFDFENDKDARYVTIHFRTEDKPSTLKDE